MNLNPVVLSIPLYFLLIGIELLIQRFSGRKLYRLNDAVTNISCGITQQLSGAFFVFLAVGVYELIYANFALFNIPTNIYSIVALFILVDLGYYWAHRMSHEINLFWGAHVVHHQSEDYNFSVALRQSSFQVVWMSMFYYPLALLGFNTLDFVLVKAINTVYQFWIHTETIGRMGILEYIFNTPSHHRVHHGRDPKYIDKNHAGVFIIWDKMFGTFQKEEETPTYGITRPINSWNPVWANFDHYAFMISDLKKIKGFGNKLKYAFNKPGWYPKDMGGYHPAPEVDKTTYRKYDTRSYDSLNYYVLFQYVLLLAGTALYLFNKAMFSFNESLFIFTMISIMVVNCGALFEGKKWVATAEKIRIIVYGTIAIYLSYANFWDPVILVIGTSYAIISLVWLTKIDKLETQRARA